MASREEARRVWNRRASENCHAGELDGPENSHPLPKSQSPATAWLRRRFGLSDARAALLAPLAFPVAG